MTEDTEVKKLFDKIDRSDLYGDQDLPPVVYGTDSMYMEFLENPNSLSKLIKHCVRYARSAPEYRTYMDYLTDNMDFSSCYFFSKLSLEESKIAGMEIHHYPFTIFDLCEIVVIKTISEGKRLTIFNVAHEVLRLHYQGLVGLIPLSKTLHEMAHDGQLYIPPEAVYGKWITFIDQHYDYLQDHHIEKIAKLHESYTDQGANIERTLNNLKIDPQIWVDRVNDIKRLMSTEEEAEVLEAEEAPDTEEVENLFEDTHD